MPKSKRSAFDVFAHADQRMTPDGRLNCALNGCLECHQVTMARYQEMLQDMIAFGAFDDYDEAEKAIFAMHKDYAAHRAIHPLLPKKSRPPRSDQEVIEYLGIGRYAELLHRKGLSVEDAIAEAAKKLHKSESKVRDARKEFLDSVKQINQAIEDMKNEESQDK